MREQPKLTAAQRPAGMLTWLEADRIPDRIRRRIGRVEQRHARHRVPPALILRLDHVIDRTHEQTSEFQRVRPAIGRERFVHEPPLLEGVAPPGIAAEGGPARGIHERRSGERGKRGGPSKKRRSGKTPVLNVISPKLHPAVEQRGGRHHPRPRHLRRIVQLILRTAGGGQRYVRCRRRAVGGLIELADDDPRRHRMGRHRGVIHLGNHRVDDGVLLDRAHGLRAGCVERHVGHATDEDR